MNSWLAEVEMQAEYNAQFDDKAERFSGEFSKCPICGTMTVDAGGHCYQGGDEPEYWEVNGASHEPGELVTVAEASKMRIEGEPQGLTDDIPF